jgi:acetylornithine deacetylase/succinyl-diaminopimelate desuccinylase family protein
MKFADEISLFVDHLFARETTFLSELVKVPSDNPPGDCAPHAARAKGLLEELGFTVEAHPIPTELAKAHGMISVTNLIVRHRLGPGPTLALNAHGDVVPPGLGWAHDPYGAEIANGPEGPVMYGRGAAVSKSDFATYAFALLALQDAVRTGAEFGGTIELHFTYDEEAGGEIGPKYLLDNGISRPDFVIAAGFSYAIVTAHNGCLHLEVEVTGKQAHAAMPHTGVDALAAATDILQAIYATRPALSAMHSRVSGITSPTVNVGLIAGGINTNVVPDRVTFRIDRRMIPEEDPATVEADLFRLIVDATASAPQVAVDVKKILLAAPLVPQPGWERLAEALRQAGTEVLRTELPISGVPLYTDARHYAARGIPCVLYGAGPRTLVEAAAHSADENLRLEDLRAATKIVALAAGEICSGEQA